MSCDGIYSYSYSNRITWYIQYEYEYGSVIVYRTRTITRTKDYAVHTRAVLVPGELVLLISILSTLNPTVPYCTVLYRTVLYCTVLYCTVLYCTVLYCTVLRIVLLYCTVCTVLYGTVLCEYCTRTSICDAYGLLRGFRVVFGFCKQTCRVSPQFHNSGLDVLVVVPTR